MISYKLAKKLKEAGFPQTYKSGSKIWIKCLLGEDHYDDFLFLRDRNAYLFIQRADYQEAVLNIEKEVEAGYYIPTLSELIEACGEEKFFLLERIPKGWIACYGKNPVCVEKLYEVPDIAVAKLWLRLNK